MTKIEAAIAEIRAIFSNEVECLYETDAHQLTRSRIRIFGRQIRLAGLNDRAGYTCVATINYAIHPDGYWEQIGYAPSSEWEPVVRTAPEPTAEEVAEVEAEEADAAWRNAPLPEPTPSLRSRVTADPEAVAFFSTWAAARDAGTELYNAFLGQVSPTWSQSDEEWFVRVFDANGTFLGFLRSAYADRGYEA